MNDIESIEKLIKCMQSSELSVEWRVSSDIGPDWIGSSREICFYLDGEELGDTQLHQQLKETLVKVANIPPSSEDYVIDGEGNVILDGNSLKVRFWWSKAIPYQDPDERGHGEGVLINA